MASLHQFGNENLLSAHEPSQEDLLLACARSRSTQVREVGEQQHLFESKATPMVEVTNSGLRLRLLVSRDLAARFGLRAE